MSHCVVPKWNLRVQERQEQVEGEERNRSPHVQSEQNLSYVVPMSNNIELTTELTWENGHLSLHGLGGINNVNPSQLSKQTWGKPGDHTLESIVHQATNKFNNVPQNSRLMHLEQQINPPQQCSLSSSMAESDSHMQVELQNEGLMKVQSSIPVVPPFCHGKCGENEQKVFKETSKRVRSELEQYHLCGRKCGYNELEVERGSEPSACASASATFCGDRDATMMTWASFESPRSFKIPRNADDDSACPECSENQDGDRITKGESYRSESSARRSRAAAVHNQSERRRRDRINEKMKALQRLVPNASKTDKASMLDEVIEYLKQLQAQVQMMSNARNMPQILIPSLGMQQQLQMSLLARMAGMGMPGMGMAGMGMPGMGIFDVNNLARNLQPHNSLIHAAAPLGGSATSFVPPPFVMPPPVVAPLKPNADAANVGNSAVPNFSDAYQTFLAQQSLNMDFFNKMAALYRQQANQSSKKPVNLSLPTDAQRE